MNNKICCIFNYGPHYRYALYQLMDKELKCDFYFGNKVNSPIKKLDYAGLKHFKKEVKNHWICNTTFIWQFGVWQLVFKKYKYYIVTGEPSILSSWLIMILGKLLGKKVLLWSHGMTGDPNEKADWFELYFYKLAHKVLLYGNHSKKVMLKRGFSKEKLVCIYNSLNHKQQVNIRKSLTKTSIFTDYFKNTNPIILYVGRIQKTKQLELLVEALEALNEKKVFCNLAFVGGDLGDNDVKEMVERKNLERKVLFFGPCYEELKLGELIYNASVCVSPGPIGLTAIHSLTYGTPAISNDNFPEQMPEFEVIQEGKSGSFYQTGNFDDFCQTIADWLLFEDELRDEIRKNCFAIIDEKWNPDFQISVLRKATLN